MWVDIEENSVLTPQHFDSTFKYQDKNNLIISFNRFFLSVVYLAEDVVVDVRWQPVAGLQTLDPTRHLHTKLMLTYKP